MKSKFSLIMLFGGVALLLLAGYFFNKAKQIEREADAMRALTQPSSEHSDTTVESLNEVLDETGNQESSDTITAFHPTNLCALEWGLRVRQYCADGDAAALDQVEGISAAETMNDLKVCLNELLHQMDAHGTDYRPMDSTVEQNEATRQNLACMLTRTYGDEPNFDKGYLTDVVKRHMESR